MSYLTSAGKRRAAWVVGVAGCLGLACLALGGGTKSAVERPLPLSPEMANTVISFPEVDSLEALLAALSEKSGFPVIVARPVTAEEGWLDQFSGRKLRLGEALTRLPNTRGFPGRQRAASGRCGGSRFWNRKGGNISTPAGPGSNFSTP